MLNRKHYYLKKSPLPKTVLVVISVLYLIGCKAPPDYNGTYIGFEEIYITDGQSIKHRYLDENKPESKWYHQSTLIIKGNSAWLEQSPISIIAADTLFSASEGGFYSYSGKIVRQNDNKISIDFLETHCDYCPQLAEKNADGTYQAIASKKHYDAILSEQGLTIDGNFFKKQ